jgi:DNA polymerase III subunit alpha
MKHADFVHLHNHSDYSLLDGASPIPRMVARAAELKMPALALTDHGSMFGAVQFYQAARKAGVKPIVGMEAYVTRGNRKERKRDTAHHLVLLCRDERGFRNLMRLSSLAFLEGFYYKPRVDHEILARYAEGLVALSACPKGEVATDLIEGTEDAAVHTAGLYRDIFGADNYFLEMQNHGLDIEDRIRAGVDRLARRTGIPVVATNDCHYLKHEDADAHDVLLCIQTGKNVDDVNRMRYETDQVYFKSAEEMKKLFADRPDAIANTLAIAERCNLQLEFGKPLLPAFPLPEGAESPEAHFRDLAWAELKTRYSEITDTLRERMAYELDVICRMGFASYFLIVRDFIHYARSRGIGVGPGRGSVAGSLVAYAMRITDVDPIQHKLIFERFLNPERVNMPDIDIDFDDLRRGEVIEYVKEKYGEGNVTQIITFGTMGAKGVMRDVGRALGMPFTDVDRIARMVPDGLGMTLERALELTPDLRNLPRKGPQFERLLKSAITLEGLARHASTHAAGVLITPGPLMDYVPLYRQKDESITTQWDMKSVEKAGLLKMDFLGLRTLSVLAEAVALVKRHHAVEVDVSKLPIDDAETYRVFQNADTVAIFQFESAGMRDYLRRLKPTVFADLTAMNALYRPGPMENIPYFIDCKHGRQVAKYDHPALEPILNDTYGVFVYQEQVMAAANALAGFSMAQGDLLRRAMGKKLPEEMDAQRKAFVEGCRKNGIAPTRAEKIFGTMEKFAGYGFNKCLVGSTCVMDADTGERFTLAEIFRSRKRIRVHALGEDWRLSPRRVRDVVWNGRKPVFDVTTARGHRLRATSNHPVRTLTGWKHVGDLSPGDAIAAARRLQVPGGDHWPRHEVIALAGLLAEGNTCHPGSLYYYNNDPLLIADFADAVSQFPDTVSRVTRRSNGRMEVCSNLGRAFVREGAGSSEWEGGDSHGNLALVVADAPRRSGMFRWASSLGILGKRAAEKSVPPGVFQLADGDLALFLGRLWSGDGFVASERDPNPCYATASDCLARDVQLMLLRFGVLSTLHVRRFWYRKERRQGYAVRIMGDACRERFLEHIAPHLIGREAAIGHLRKAVELRAGGSSLDTVPSEARSMVNRERLARDLTWKALEKESGVSTRELTGRGSHVKRGFRRSTLEKLGRHLGSVSLVALSTSDVHWDRVATIEPAGVEDTYDLTVEGDHNFVANGLVVHNSHSAAYALVAYQCAWFKTHYPAEFMAATLTSEMSDSTRVVTLIEECRRMGLEILAPDVNASEWKFTIEEGRIRYGLGAVRNVGQNSVESIVAARASGGAFEDLFELARRLDGRAVNRRVLESLIAAGACDAFGVDRGILAAGAGRMLEHAIALQKERESGQSSLFGEGDGGVAVAAPSLPGAEAWSHRERSAKEKEALGFYFSDHPLDPMRDALARIATHTVADAQSCEDGTEVRMAGLLGDVRRITTRSGKTMGAVIFEDLTGRIEATLFPEAYEKHREMLVPESIVVMTGRIEVSEERGSKLLLADLQPFEQAQETYRPCLHIELKAQELSEQRLEGIDEVLSSHPGPCEVYLHIVRPDHSRLAMRSRRFRVAEADTVSRALRERYAEILRTWWGKGAG